TYLQELLSSYPKAYQVGERYESMLRNTWDESLKRLAVEVRKSPDRKIEYKDFFDSYITIFGEEYDRLLRSPEYTELQANLSSMVSTTILASQKMMEAQLEMFPALPFAPREDVDALAQRVHSVKRRLNTLERNVRQIERMNSPQGDILEGLAARVAEIEEKLRKLPVETTELEGCETTGVPHAHPRTKERE
ncbi:MAG: hypothetical protein FJZ95_00405, partial [Chloroflexi bacterium]|nr:hypothetical protein [Chloroflexota bacterium]